MRKKQTTVPLDRIQGLDTVAGPVQRLFGVVAVHVQTAGGGAKGEVVLDAVGAGGGRAAARGGARAAARGRRGRAGGPRPAGAAAEPPRRADRRAHRRPARRDPAVAGGRASSSSPTSSRTSGASRRRRGCAPDTLGGWELAIGALLLAGVGALGGGVAGGVRGLHGHARRRAAADPARAAAAHRGRRCRCGACTPCAWSRACCGGRSGSRRCGSRSPATPSEAAAARTLFPLLRRAEVEPFLAELLPELADDPGDLEPPPARAARRYVLPKTRWPAWSWAAAPASSSPPSRRGRCCWRPLLALDGWLDYRAAGWRLRDGRLAMRSRRLAWSTLLDARRAAAAARDRAEPAAAPRRASPTSRWRSARAATRRSATSSCRSRPSCGNVCGDDERVLLRHRLALRLPHGRAAPARRRGVEADLARRPVEAERRRVVGADRPPRGGDRRDRGARRALRAAADPLAGAVARPLPERDARLPGRRPRRASARSSPASRRAWASPRAATSPR